MKTVISTSLLISFLLMGFAGCESDNSEEVNKTLEEEQTADKPEDDSEDENSSISKMYRGADLSYVNEMEDCGGIYRDREGNDIQDIFGFFEKNGANLIRVRLWHNPDWTEYSNLEDVKRTISRAKANNMEVLLDFHYSDTWADTEKQIIPVAWENITEVEILADSVYQYTYNTLIELSEENLMPNIVQVGNETNREILQQEGNHSGNIDWRRNVKLFNSGLKAVKNVSNDTGEEIETMLHIAQPENALWWFEEAQENGIGDYDWIGLSYYPIWASYSLDRLGNAIKELKSTYNKKLMIVETAYPFTLNDADSANNILGEDALVSRYKASPEGQKQYMKELLIDLSDAGAEGLIYWEPAWISTNCSTLWGQGSHWDNATFFDNETGEALQVFDFLDPSNY